MHDALLRSHQFLRHPVLILLFQEQEEHFNNLEAAENKVNSNRQSLFFGVHMERYLSRDLLQSFQLLASLMLPCQVTLLPSQSQALSNKRPMSFPQLWANLQGMKLVSKINKQPGFLSHYFASCIWLKSCFQKTTTPSNCSVSTKSQFHWFTSYLGFGRRFLRIDSAGTCHLFLRNLGAALGRFRVRCLQMPSFWLCWVRSQAQLFSRQVSMNIY